ncbi:hypothetical protein ACRAWG_20935 [Methylobacterium sp. P31]
MTNFGDQEPPPQQPDRGLPRRLVFAITVSVFSVPVAGLPLMAWPFMQQHTNVVLGQAELICPAGAAFLIGGVLASYALGDRGAAPLRQASAAQALPLFAGVSRMPRQLRHSGYPAGMRDLE